MYWKESLRTKPYSVATGYGQPPSTIYDWALEPASLNDADYHPSTDLRDRLRIEKFCDKVTKALYSSKPEAADYVSSEKFLIVQLLESELRDMEAELASEISRMDHVHCFQRCPLFSKMQANKLVRYQHDPSACG